MLADSFRATLITGDRGALQEYISSAMRNDSDLRYVIVYDRDGWVVAHSFRRTVPPDLLDPASLPAVDGQVQVLRTAQGRIFDAQFPVLDGHLGKVRIGLSGRATIGEASRLNRTIAWDFALALAVSVSLVILMGQLLARPIHDLVAVSERIGEGDFAARAQVGSSDEVGQLADAFNRMADRLERYRAHVLERDEERIRLLDQTVQAQEEERKSIALELHDHIGQSLLAHLLAVETLASKGELPQAVAENLTSRIRQTIDEVRRLAWGMRPTILDDYGLKVALSRYLDDVCARGTIRFDYVFDVPDALARFPSRIEVTLYRVTQEAVTNIIRHSGARRASLVLARRPKEVTLLIEDFGHGADGEGPQDHRLGGIGLVSMRERVTLLGGEFLFESSPGGTTIRVRIPVQEGKE
jgi:signal transduction histidine kinase